MAELGQAQGNRLVPGFNSQWQRPPSFGKFLLDGIRLGGMFGAVLGLTPTLFDPGFIWSAGSGLLLIPVGAVIGMTCGATFAALSWPLSKWLVRLGVSMNKGLALSLGVTLVGALFVGIAWLVVRLRDPDAQVLFMVVLVSSILASGTSLVVGHRYDRSHHEEPSPP